MVPSGEEMHTALECEVTIKPRFVYIPSPRTGPVRGRACESRDGTGGRERPGLGPPPGASGPGRGCPQLLLAVAASRRAARGGRRVGPWGGGGDPRPSAHCGALAVTGAAWAPRGRRAGTPGPEAGPRGSAAWGGNGRHPPSSGPTEKARRGAREQWRPLPGPRSGAWDERGAAAGFVPGSRGAGRRGRGRERREAADRPARRGVRASLLPRGVFGSPQAGEAAGGLTWKGFLWLPRRRVHVGACPHGPSCRSWARGSHLAAGRPATGWEGSFPPFPECLLPP